MIAGAHELLLKLAKPLQVSATAILVALLAEVAIRSKRAILNGVARDMTFCTPELILHLLLAFELLELLLHFGQKPSVKGFSCCDAVSSA